MQSDIADIKELGLVGVTTACFTAGTQKTRAKDRVGSIRVLEKCGFTVQGEDVGFANARAAEIAELVLKRERPR